MDVNAIGLPVNRPALPPARATDESEVPGAKNYAPSAALEKVNTAKSALPDGVGAKVDKTA